MIKQLRDIAPIIRTQTKETSDEVRTIHKEINELLYKQAFDYIYPQKGKSILEDITVYGKRIAPFAAADKKADEILKTLRTYYKELNNYINTWSEVSDEEKKKMANALIAKKYKWEKELHNMTKQERNAFLQEIEDDNDALNELFGYEVIGKVRIRQMRQGY